MTEREHDMQAHAGHESHTPDRHAAGHRGEHDAASPAPLAGERGAGTAGSAQADHGEHAAHGG